MSDEVEGVDCSPCLSYDRCRSTTYSLLLGQVLSLCLAGTGIFSQLLSDKYHVNTPTAQSFVNYFLLCFVYTTLLACKPGEDGLINVVRRRGFRYFLLAIFDVEANYLIVLAYQYTNLTSVQLLDCFTIPVVLVLSWLFLRVRYLVLNVVGVVVCLIGLACLIWADSLVKDGAHGGSNRLLGDVLCLSGAVLYGFSNVGEEFLVKNYSRVEYLGMIGLFGSFISGIQLSIIEREALGKVMWNDVGLLLCFGGFAVCMFVFYSLVAVVMKRTSATLFNLAIQSADFYTLLAGIFLFQFKFHILYFASFGLTVIGSIIYSLREPHRHSGSAICHRCCPNTSQSTLNSNKYEEIPGVIVQSPVTLSETVRFCPIHGTVAVTPNQNRSTAISEPQLNI